MRCGAAVTLEHGESMGEPGKPLAHAFFPIDCSIAVLVLVAGQPQLEVGLIGREGMLGLPLILGGSSASLRAIVQTTGTSWRVDVDRFSRQLARSAPMRGLLNDYVNVRYLQLAETAACKSFHPLDGRLARWLLMSRDRVRSRHLALTHDFLAQMLGVRRAGVTVAASALQNARLIRYTRGHIELLDIRALEARACACYASEKRIYSRLMS